MFRNYLSTALRNLVRRRLYAAINIVGLAVGFAAALLIALFARDEFSYDKWLPGHERILRVSMEVQMPGAKQFSFDTSDYAVAKGLALDIQGVEAVARLVKENKSVRRGEFEVNEAVFWADADFFEVMPLAPVAGDLRTALRAPDALVITLRTARKYFGKDAPIGETLELDRKHSMRVAAVIDDLPSNTHLAFDILAAGSAAFSPLARLDARPSGFHFDPVAYTYARLSPNAELDDVRRELPKLVERRLFVSPGNKMGVSMEIILDPIADIHLQPAGLQAMKSPGNVEAVVTLAVVGILIVAAAGINFVNLMTARAARRATEVGIRKVCGAQRSALMIQFIGEATIYTALAMAAAVALAAVLLPTLNAFLGRTIEFGDGSIVLLLASIIAVMSVTALLAGAYPALVLSAMRPAVMTGLRQSPATAALRRTLVVLQFALLTGLVLATSVIHQQRVYATSDSLRLDADGVLLVHGGCGEAFRNAANSLPGVLDTTCSLSAPTNASETAILTQVGGGQPQTTNTTSVDVGFFEFYGLQPMAGRFFADAYGSDVMPVSTARKPPVTASAVINEAALRLFEFNTPEAAIGRTVHGIKNATAYTIIGVAADVPVSSVREPVRPTLFVVDRTQLQLLSVKISGENLPETLRSLEAAWRQHGPARPIQFQFLDQYLQDLYTDVTRQADLFTTFAGIAILIAALGLFGLSAFIAELRTREIGIRKSMGARRADILRLLLWQFAKPVLLANVIAWPAAYFIMQRWLEGFAYHIDLSAWMFLSASALALVIAMATVIGHTLLVARAQPAAALRYE